MGILGGSSSPTILLIGGIATSATGPNAPMIQDQKIAGFSCDAHRRYRIGEPQNVFGTAAAMVVRVGGFAGEEKEDCSRSFALRPNGGVRPVVTTGGLDGTLRAPNTLSRRVACVLSRWKGWLQVVEAASVGSFRPAFSTREALLGTSWR